MRYRLIGSGGPKPVAIRIFAVVTFAFVLLLHTAATVKAQPVCMPHDDFRVELDRNFLEAPVAIAIANSALTCFTFPSNHASGCISRVSWWMSRSFSLSWPG